MVTDGNVHCPPCDAIRHGKWEFEQKQRIIVGVSAMNQVEIVRETRRIFENTGAIPHPTHIDAALELKPDFLAILEKMLRKPSEFSPEDLKLTDSLKCFFTRDGSDLFKDTMLTYVCFLHFKYITLYNFLSRKMPKFDSNLKSTIQAAREADIRHLWVHNPRFPKLKDVVAPAGLFNIWKKKCDKGQPTILDIHKLAVEFNILSGKWLVLATPDSVDKLWERIVKTTLAGALGDRARVSTGYLPAAFPKHVIWIYNTDYRSEAEVMGIRTALWQLGVTKGISYKPEICSLLGIRKLNNLRIRAEHFFRK